MKTFLIISTIILILFVSNSTFGQSVFSNCPDYTIDIRKTGSQSTITMFGLKQIVNCNPLYVYEIGKNSSTRKRGVYQWNISEIPDGSTIDNITLEFSFEVIFYSECNLKYFNVGTDITSPNLNLDDLYDATHYTQTGIGDGFGGPSTNYVISTTFTGVSNAFIIAFTNALSQNRFTVGAAWKYDDPTAGNAEWYVTPRAPTLIVHYTPPLVTLDQRLNDNTQVGKLRKWEGTDFTPYPYINPGAQFEFPVNSQQTILGDQTVISNQKYKKWTTLIIGDEASVINHHSFITLPNNNTYTSRFEPTQNGVNIKNSLEGTTIDGGQIEFLDPWFIDYPDPLFPNPQGGYYIRNRGMNDAIYYQCPSPFNPTNGG
jgi:hypothetical protein